MKNNKLAYLLIGILVIWCIILTSMVNKNTSETDEIVNEYNVVGISTDLTKIVEEKKDAIVTVGCNGIVSTGFVYKQNGEDIYVLTSYHGVSSGGIINVRFSSGFNATGEIIGQDLYLDLAVVTIKSPYEVNALNLVDASALKSGEFVISIGTPISLEYDQSVELGMVSNNIRTIENSITVDETEEKYYLDVIQLSANLKPGYSGSPIINMQGDVVGMTTMSLVDGYNFAVDANEIKIVADKIINEEKVNKNQLGVKGTYIEDMPLFEKSNLNLSVDTIYGLFVDKVMENSIASNAGLKYGDVVLSINDVEIHNINDYLNIAYSETDSFEFEFIRDSQVNNSKVEIND